jgi:hypothetical protein
MSYDIELTDPVSGETLHAESPHDIRGGTCVMGGTTELSLNVTYNYSTHYYRTLGEKGIRTIYGMTGAESWPLLKSAAEQLGNDVDGDYWKATEGNAKRALLQLVALAQLRPDGIWKGD